MGYLVQKEWRLSATLPVILRSHNAFVNFSIAQKKKKQAQTLLRYNKAQLLTPH